MPTESIDEYYIFDHKTGKRLDVSLTDDIQTHGADVEWNINKFYNLK